LAGQRSGLFFEIVRLTSEIRPRFVFLENVSAITIRGAERIIGEFCRLRYDCRWGILSASDVGANHRRDRWWLLAYCKRKGLEGQSQNGPAEEGWKKSNGSTGEGSICKDVADSAGKQSRRLQFGGFQSYSGASGEISDTSGEPVAGSTPWRSKRQEPYSPRADWWQSEPNVGRVAHGVPFRVDCLKGLGNAVVPAQAREAFERLMGLK